jgi:hypothetical protein
MAFQQRHIVTYELSWNHLSNQPGILLQLQGGGPSIPLRVSNAEEIISSSLFLDTRQFSYVRMALYSPARTSMKQPYNDSMQLSADSRRI